MAPSSLTPMLTIKDAVAASDFYREAFGAVERERSTAPPGRWSLAVVEDQAGSAGEGGRAALTRVVGRQNADQASSAS